MPTATAAGLYAEDSKAISTFISQKRPATPWLSILTSVPSWTLSISLLCNLWGSYTVLTMLPTYMATILRFSLTGVFFHHLYQRRIIGQRPGAIDKIR